MGEMFEDLKIFLEKSELKDKVVLRFVDVLEDDLDAYEAVKKVLDKGLPVTVINGKAKFNGGLSIRKIYEEIKKCEKQHCQEKKNRISKVLPLKRSRE